MWQGLITCKILDVHLLLVLDHLRFHNVDKTIFLQVYLLTLDPNILDDMLLDKYRIRLFPLLVGKPHSNLDDLFAKVKIIEYV